MRVTKNTLNNVFVCFGFMPLQNPIQEEWVILQVIIFYLDIEGPLDLPILYKA